MKGTFNVQHSTSTFQRRKVKGLTRAEVLAIRACVTAGIRMKAHEVRYESGGVLPLFPPAYVAGYWEGVKAMVHALKEMKRTVKMARAFERAARVIERIDRKRGRQ